MSSLNSIANGKPSSLDDLSSSSEPSSSSSSSKDSLQANQFLAQNLEKVDKSLISTLKHPNIYSSLPQEVKNLIGRLERQYDLNLTQFAAVQPSVYFQANNVTIGTNSLPFVDQAARIGRRGYLTYLNLTSANSQLTWTVANS